MTTQTQMQQEYRAQDHSHLGGDTPFSEELVETHLKLYEGYVKHTNKALRLLASDLDGYAAAEVRRRLVWEFNGMRLHEVYFGAMKPGGTELEGDAPLREALDGAFGDLEAWDRDFRQTGSTRGIGWACLSYDPVQDRLLNQWIEEHDAGSMAGTDPILIMDVFEHAFIRDFGTDRAAYMEAYFGTVDWAKANQRFEQARACAGHRD